MIHSALLVNMQRGDGDHVRGFLGRSPLRAARGWGPCQGLPGVVTAAVSSRSATNREHCPNLVIAQGPAVAKHWVAPLLDHTLSALCWVQCCPMVQHMGDLGHPIDPTHLMLCSGPMLLVLPNSTMWIVYRWRHHPVSHATCCADRTLVTSPLG